MYSGLNFFTVKRKRIYEMTLELLKGKIHRATVVQAELELCRKHYGG